MSFLINNFIAAYQSDCALLFAWFMNLNYRYILHAVDFLFAFKYTKNYLKPLLCAANCKYTSMRGKCIDMYPLITHNCGRHPIVGQTGKPLSIVCEWVLASVPLGTVSIYIYIGIVWSYRSTRPHVWLATVNNLHFQWLCRYLFFFCMFANPLEIVRKHTMISDWQHTKDIFICKQAQAHSLCYLVADGNQRLYSFELHNQVKHVPS